MTKPKVGEIYVEKAGHRPARFYVTYINELNPKENGNVLGIYDDGFSMSWTYEKFDTYFEPTGDHVPFEDIAAILFPTH